MHSSISQRGIAQPPHMERSGFLHVDELQATQVQILLLSYLHNIGTYTHKFSNTLQCVYSNRRIPPKYFYQWRDTLAIIVNIYSSYFLMTHRFILRSTMTPVLQFQWYPLCSDLIYPHLWIGWKDTLLVQMPQMKLKPLAWRLSTDTPQPTGMVTNFSCVASSLQRNTDATHAVTPQTPVSLIPRVTRLLPYLSYIPKWTMMHLGKKIRTHHLPGPQDTGSLARPSALLSVS